MPHDLSTYIDETFQRNTRAILSARFPVAPKLDNTYVLSFLDSSTGQHLEQDLVVFNGKVKAKDMLPEFINVPGLKTALRAGNKHFGTVFGQNDSKLVTATRRDS